MANAAAIVGGAVTVLGALALILAFLVFGPVSQQGAPINQYFAQFQFDSNYLSSTSCSGATPTVTARVWFTQSHGFQVEVFSTPSSPAVSVFGRCTVDEKTLIWDCEAWLGNTSPTTSSKWDPKLDATASSGPQGNITGQFYGGYVTLQNAVNQLQGHFVQPVQGLDDTTIFGTYIPKMLDGCKQQITTQNVVDAYNFGVIATQWINNQYKIDQFTAISNLYNQVYSQLTAAGFVWSVTNINNILNQQPIFDQIVKISGANPSGYMCYTWTLNAPTTSYGMINAQVCGSPDMSQVPSVTVTDQFGNVLGSGNSDGWNNFWDMYTFVFNRQPGTSYTWVAYTMNDGSEVDLVMNYDGNAMFHASVVGSAFGVKSALNINQNQFVTLAPFPIASKPAPFASQPVAYQAMVADYGNMVANSGIRLGAADIREMGTIRAAIKAARNQLQTTPYGSPMSPLYPGMHIGGMPLNNHDYVGIGNNCNDGGQTIPAYAAATPADTGCQILTQLDLCAAIHDSTCAAETYPWSIHSCASNLAFTQCADAVVAKYATPGDVAPYPSSTYLVQAAYVSSTIIKAMPCVTGASTCWAQTLNVCNVQYSPNTMGPTVFTNAKLWASQSQGLSNNNCNRPNSFSSSWLASNFARPYPFTPVSPSDLAY